MSYFTTADGTRLFYTDEGAGTPVLCLAGLTRNHRDFDHVLPHLSGRVIRMDYRGRGASDWPGPDTYSVRQEGADALALLDHLGIEKAAILGTSRGGLIAMSLAMVAKTRLLGVALNDIGPEIGPDIDRIKDYLGRDPKAPNFDAVIDAWKRALPGFANVPESHWRHSVEVSLEQTPDGLRNRYDNRLREAMLRDDAHTPDLWPYFDALEGLPTLLIRGLGSQLLSAETAAKMQARRPDMIVAEVPDRGHIPFLDEAPAVAGLQRWQEAIG